MNRKLVISAAVLALTAPSVAFAQADRAADRADSRLRRLDAKPAMTMKQKQEQAQARRTPTVESAATTTEDAKAWTLKFVAPITYNSNIDAAPTDERGAVHATPSVTLSWARGLKDGPEVSARFTADADIYTGDKGDDSSGLLGQVRADFVNAKLGEFTPYAFYRAQDLRADFYGDHDSTLHNVAFGLAREVTLSPTTTFSMDFQVARREASKKTAEQYRTTMTLGLEGAFNEKVGWSIEQAVQRRDYTGGDNKGRDDWNFATTLSFTTDLNDKGATLDASIYLEHNESSKSGNDFNTWDIGPSITLKQPF